MTANIRFITTNLADTATITASSTSGTLVAANLQADERAAVWRSATLEIASAPTVNAAGTGYVPTNTITLLVTGSTSTVKGVVTVATTKVVSATIQAAGTGGTPGAAVVTGTTGTGTKFQANVTINGTGNISSVDSISVGGSYTVNPTNIAIEPVTGGGLSGAALTVVMGVNTITLTTSGTYTVGGTVATQFSTSGTGTGATFTGLLFVVVTQTLLLEWAATTSINSICMAWANFTSAATIEIKGFTLTTDYPATPAFTENFTSEAAFTNVDPQAQCWLSATFPVRKILITIADTTNTDAYIEISRLAAGVYISPVKNASYEAFSIGWVEQTKPARAESRDLRIDTMGRFRRMQINLPDLESVSRNDVINMIAKGLGSGVWVAVFPDDSAVSTRQLHGFWGALVQDSNLTYPLFNAWATTLVFEEMG